MATAATVLAAQAAAMPEAVLSEEVRRACKTLRLLAYHTHLSKHSAAGFPDWTILNPRTGDILYRELKRERQHPTAAQQEWLDALAVHGDADVWRPSDWLSGRITRELAKLAALSTRR